MEYHINSRVFFNLGKFWSALSILWCFENLNTKYVLWHAYANLLIILVNIVINIHQEINKEDICFP